ncbi:MAG: pilin [Candidatus Paceibacterota bacterium]|jgi:hypothetical protein
MKFSTKIKKILFIAVAVVAFSTPVSYAAPTLNPFSPDFRLSVCDGPTIPPKLVGEINGLSDPQFKERFGHDRPYVACDFQGLMLQAQFLITAMIMLGALAAIVSFTYAGILYLTGTPGKIDQAKDIFKKVGIGFLMMLTAWFIIYQLMEWLVDNKGIMSLLGSP